MLIFMSRFVWRHGTALRQDCQNGGRSVDIDKTGRPRHKNALPRRSTAAASKGVINAGTA
jgi:hypothetical protein